MHLVLYFGNERYPIKLSKPGSRPKIKKEIFALDVLDTSTQWS